MIALASDERVKKDIRLIDAALTKVSQLRGVTFKYYDGQVPQGGLIAQEVEKVLPGAVVESPDGIKHVQYWQVIGLLVEAINELQEKLDG